MLPMRRSEFERALAGQQFAFSLLVHSDYTTAALVDFQTASSVLQVTQWTLTSTLLCQAPDSCVGSLGCYRQCCDTAILPTVVGCTMQGSLTRV